MKTLLNQKRQAARIPDVTRSHGMRAAFYRGAGLQREDRKCAME